MKGKKTKGTKRKLVVALPIETFRGLEIIRKHQEDKTLADTIRDLVWSYGAREHRGDKPGPLTAAIWGALEGKEN